MQQLRALRVKDPTFLKYHEAVELLEAYARRRRMALKPWQKADIVMAEYFADLFEDGACYNAALYCLGLVKPFLRRISFQKLVVR